MATIFKQTVKGTGPWLIFTLWSLLKALTTVPAMMLVYTIPSFRPSPGWTWWHAIVAKVLKDFLTYAAITELKTPQITRSKHGAGEYVHIPLASDRAYGNLVGQDGVKPIETGGVWAPTAPKTPLQPDQYVLIHYHGGAYMMFSPADAQCQAPVRKFARMLRTSALLPDYRLSCHTGCHFPAALQDSISAYQSVLDRGISADRIILSGDSAGGHLVLSLLRHISENPDSLPWPAGAALWSPWVDMTSTNASILNSPKYKTDFIPPEFNAWALQHFLPPGADASGPYFTPMLHPFRSRTKLFIHSAQGELLNTSHRKLNAAYSAVQGNEVEYVEVPYGMHDVFAGGADGGFKKEQEDGLKAAIKFLAT